jgi:hypothetical protein
VFLGDRLEKGSAKDVLRSIQDHAPKDSDIIAMDVTDYANLLLKDADYFIPRGVLEFIERQEYPTVFDKALSYLAQMESGHVRILSKEAA